MSIVTIEDTNLTNIADAIRRKSGTSNTYKPSEMAGAINNITTKEDLSIELTEQDEIITAQELIIQEILSLLKSIADDTLTAEQITALNNMVISSSNDELILEYDDEVLDVDFNIANQDLIVTNNVTALNFSINKNGEMEAIY